MTDEDYGRYGADVSFVGSLYTEKCRYDTLLAARQPLACQEPERTWVIPTVVCKNKNQDEWYVDEEAYAHTLIGDGVIEYKLLTQVLKDGTATISGIRYEGLYLLKMFLEKALELPRKAAGVDPIAGLVIAVSTLDVKLMDSLLYCADYLEIPRERVHIISHTESFIYYVMSQKKELWVNQVGMFDFRDSRITYYQMQADRLKRPAIVKVAEKDYSDYAQLFISGEQTDEEKSSIFEVMVHGAIHGQIITSLYMTGAGFENDFAADVMKKLCVGRHLFKGDNLYVCGACYMARELGGERRLDDVVYLGEDIVTSDLTIQVYADAQERELPLVRAGTAWYHIEKEMDLIQDGDQELAVCIKNVVTKKQSVRLIPMDGILGRTDRRARVGIQIRFSGPDRCIMTLRDKGFGEFFPSSYRIWEETITL